MRLLPRTPRGTVLLAAAAWLAAVVALWELLPYRPSMTFTVPAGQGCTAVPGRRAFLFYGLRRDAGPGRPATTGPLRLFDADAGRVVREFLGEGDALLTFRPSPDGRHLCVLQPAGGSQVRIRVFDLTTGDEFRE